MHHAMLPSDIVSDVLHKSGYLEALNMEDSIEARTRIENINEFLGAVREFEENFSTENGQSSLAALLDMLSLQTSVDEMDETFGTLSLMTIHCAKGLEFDVVFIVGMEEEIFPHKNVLENAERDLEEERRLCYVAITRARKKVFMSYAKMRRLYGNMMRNLPSRFLGEIPREYVTTPFGSLDKPKFDNDVRYDYDSLFLSDEIEIDYTW